MVGAMAALMATTAFGAQAGQFDAVSLSYGGGVAPHLTMAITNGATTANPAVVGTLSNSIGLDMDGHVKCVKDKSVDFIGSKMFFGAAHVFVDQVAETNTLHSEIYHPSFSEWRGSLSGWISEAGDAEDFEVPSNQVKAGPPLQRFDPAEEFDKALEADINIGGTKLDFMQNDQVFYGQRMISMSGARKASKYPYEGQGKVALDVSKSVAESDEGSNVHTLRVRVRFPCSKPAVRPSPTGERPSR